MYFGTSVVVLSLSTAFTVILLNLHYRGQFGTNVPGWIRTLVLGCLANLMGLRETVNANVTSKEAKASSIHKSNRRLLNMLNVLVFPQILRPIKLLLRNS